MASAGAWVGGEHTVFRPGLAVSVAMAVILVVTGIWYFRKTERAFADVI